MLSLSTDLVRRFGVSHVLLAVSLVLNLGLVLSLQRERAMYRAQVSEDNGIGEIVESFAVEDLGAQKLVFNGANAVPTILYAFSPSCTYCELNFANSEAVYAQTKGRYRFLAMAIATTSDELKRYRERKQPQYELLHLSDESARALGFFGTPRTMILSAEGVIQAVWNGAWGGSFRAEVERTLDVDLPSKLISHRVTTVTGLPAKDEAGVSTENRNE